MTTFSEQLASVVRGMLAEHDVSQEDAAASMGRAQSYVSVRVRGQKPWNTADLDALARLMGMTPAELLREIVTRAERDRRQGDALRSR